MQENKLYSESITLIKLNKKLFNPNNYHWKLYSNFYSSQYYDSAYFHLKQVDSIDFNIAKTKVDWGFIHNDIPYVQENISVLSTYHENNTDDRYMVSICLLNDSFPQSQTFNVDNDLNFIIERHKDYKDKSPTISAGLSTMLPGLGKMYLGYRYQAIASFLITSLLAGVTYELFINEAPQYLWGTSLSLTSIFYFGNIYGSYVGAKRRRIDHKAQVYEDIKYYYLNNL